jgi:predicted phage gp36 major capsid-like protein
VNRDVAALIRATLATPPKRVGGGVQDFDAIKLLKFAVS